MGIKLVIWFLIHIQAVLSSSTFPKLLVISYDAFRFDYFNRNITPFMNNLKEEGTAVDHMNNAFVTKTLPNHHTMVTGFYVESHGVLESQVFTSDGRKAKNNAELFHYNENILPIWTINEQGGKTRHSGSIMWPGSEYEYNKTKATFAIPLNVSVSWEARADQLISWFTDLNTPINLGMLYIEEPDAHAHGLGINHPEINRLLRKLDNFTKYVNDKLVENNLTDVNVIHLSDHGMVDVSINNIINITGILNSTGCDYIITSNTIFIKPHPDHETIVYNKLKKLANDTGKFYVYKKSEIPDRFHYKNSDRMTPIYAVTKSGYAFDFLYQSIAYYEKVFNISVSNESSFGIHGYDNEDPYMHPIFFARGPAFSTHCKLEPFNNVDLFPLFCHILQLHCPPANGTLDSFKKCLTHFNNDTYNSTYAVILMVLVAAIITSILIFIYFRRKREKEKVLYQKSFHEGSE